MFKTFEFLLSGHTSYIVCLIADHIKYDTKHWQTRITYIVRKLSLVYWVFTDNQRRYDAYTNPYLLCLWIKTKVSATYKTLKHSRYG
jgi:hypothetical protein